MTYDAKRETWANSFLDAWQAASADYPAGRTNTPELYEFVDVDRISQVMEYLPQRFRLLTKTVVRQAGEGFVFTKGSGESVRTKVFLSDVRIHSQAGDIDQTANLRIWVAKDNELVVRFMLENIVFP